VEIFGIHHFHILSNENKRLNPWTLICIAVTCLYAHFCIRT